ncbi:MAG: diguanylate cyclase [Pseudomonadota bacterium]
MNILIVEDDPVHTKLLSGLLGRWGYQVHSAANGEDAIRVLEQGQPISLAIVDWMMPKMDGLQLCREIRERFNEPYRYLILLTARDQRDDIIQGFDAGADDYLVKPVHHNELSARLRAAKRLIDTQQKLLDAQEKLREQATHDTLTGIWNRGAIFATLEAELERAVRQQTPCSIVMIDLDHFKNVNDTHGHPIGDQVLVEAARRIRGSLRPYDVLGRYGGEEFLVVAPGCDQRSAGELAERIRSQFCATPIATSGPTLPLTLSAGVVALEAGERVELNRWLATADQALYQAKSNGRNTCAAGTLRP